MLALTGVLSVAELSTAMPKAGGDYFFITRSIGALAGSISGLFSWFALASKSAFAIIGISEVLFFLLNINVNLSAIILCILFLLLNIIGVKEAGRFQVVLVTGLLILLAGYIILGLPRISMNRFEPFAPHGLNAIFATAGFVFISYGGLLKIASISEEVKNPQRNIPLGLISSLAVVTILYAVVLIVTVGVSNPDELSRSLTPIAVAARTFSGIPGYVAITIASLFAFFTTAKAGIMSASRYPLALSRDKLLPKFISRVNPKLKTPVISIIITGLFIVVFLILKLEFLVKAASTFIILNYILANISLIIMRESKIGNYRPSFKSPLYPWIQIVGIAAFIFLLIDMGYQVLSLSAAIISAGLLLYFIYGRRRNLKESALLHLIERITNKELTGYNLEAELREILHQRDDIPMDRFDQLIKKSPVLDLKGPIEVDDFFQKASARLANETGMEKNALLILLQAREMETSTAISPFVAIPHLIVEGNNKFNILLVRCREGIKFSEENESIKAVFVLLGTKDERNFHLKSLSSIAQIVQNEGFEERWLAARNEGALADILLLGERKRT